LRSFTACRMVFGFDRFAGMIFPEFITEPAPTRPPPNETWKLFMSTNYKLVPFGGGAREGGGGLKPFRHVLPPHTSQRIADLAERDVILHALNEQRHQIVRAFGRVYQLP